MDAKEGTLIEIAQRFQVSAPWITKMRRQRRDLGTLEPQTHRCGRKPFLDDSQREQLAELVRNDADATLKELREQLGVACCLFVIWKASKQLGLTYKKSQSELLSKTGQMFKSDV